jgi:hypothetical protein
VTGLLTTEGAYVTVNTFAGNATANAVLHNTGSIEVSANASANAGGEASATAQVDWGIYQQAEAHAASAAFAHATLTNGAYGTIEVLANARATGSSANAQASIGTTGWTGAGISQEATASGTAGTASALMTNSGNITIAANAVANATSGSAQATAGIHKGIFQNAEGVDRALVSLSNAAYATIAIAANANAHGQTDGSAYANIDSGISQDATSTAVGGYATAELTNNGTISIGASANAFGGRDGSASATAHIDYGIFQYANAYSSASVNLVNNGALSIHAAASASADEDATATAGIGIGVSQWATATGDGGNASASLTNTG